MALNELLESYVTSWDIGWWSEEDEDSPVELYLDLKNGMDISAGLWVAQTISICFNPFDWDYGSQYALSGADIGMRLMFEQEEGP